MRSHLIEEISSSRNIFSLYKLPKRNLGCAILAAAIADYRSDDEQAHASAKKFLFPTTPEYRRHYDWAAAMADGVNREWLREALDKARCKWDLERGLTVRRKRAPESDGLAQSTCCGRPRLEAAHG